VAPKPVNVLAGMKGANFPLADLQAAGGRRISLGGALARAALGALMSAGREMKEKGTFTFVEDAAPSAEVNSIMTDRSREAGKRGND
jgi:2-methylisocitrate lyase-like PEP mutase family enzyme